MERKALAVLGAAYIAVGAFFYHLLYTVTATDKEPYFVCAATIVLGVGIWLALAVTRRTIR